MSKQEKDWQSNIGIAVKCAYCFEPLRFQQISEIYEQPEDNDHFQLRDAGSDHKYP